MKFNVKMESFINKDGQVEYYPVYSVPKDFRNTVGFQNSARSLPPASTVQTPGFSLSSEMVPWLNPATGKIEYVPDWYVPKPGK